MSSLIYSKRAHGKLLLSGEYAVLDGALALAMPTTYGQHLTVKSADSFRWTSYEMDGSPWLHIDRIEHQDTDSEASMHLKTILYDIFGTSIPYQFEMTADFDRRWGLGSSSTFIALLADFSAKNAYTLNTQYFKGSGYDIACAFSDHPICYQRVLGKAPIIEAVQIPKSISEHIYFVYTGKKQDSREGIARYRMLHEEDRTHLVHELSSITKELIRSKDIHEWQRLLEDHEALLSRILKLPRIQNTLWSHLPYFCKSLGAWGGDFAMIIADAGNKDELKKNLGPDIILFAWSELIASAPCIENISSK